MLKCDGATVSVTMESKELAETTYPKLSKGDLVSASRGWACKNTDGKVVTLMRRISGNVVLDGSTIIMETTEASYTDFFKHLTVDFHTSAYPEDHFQEVPVENRTEAEEGVINMEPIHPANQRRKLWSVWGGIKHLYHSVADSSFVRHVKSTFKAAVTVGKMVVGSPVNCVVSKTLAGFSWNYKGGHARKKNLIVDKSHPDLKCSNCYAHAGLKAVVSLSVASHSLKHVKVYAHADAVLHTEGTFSASYTKTIKGTPKHITTIKAPSIDFMIGPIPVSIDVTVPISMGYVATFQAKASAKAHAHAQGKAVFGMQKYGHSKMRPIKEQSFNWDGGIEELKGSFSASLNLYLLPVVEIIVEKIGGPTVALQPSLTLTVDGTAHMPSSWKTESSGSFGSSSSGSSGSSGSSSHHSSSSHSSTTLVNGGLSGCSSSHKCPKCKGDCDHDSDCQAGLFCFQRNGHTAVPGCRSGGSGDVKNRDYCAPRMLVSKGGSGCSSSHKCGKCQGDCDKDSDCASGLRCFLRNGHTHVPGCGSGGTGDVKNYDYCVPISGSSSSHTSSHTSSCADNAKTTFTNSKKQRMTCHDLRGYCKSSRYGASVRKQCPRTCGTCGGSSHHRDPCAGVNCGSHGSCHNGKCSCHSG